MFYFHIFFFIPNLFYLFITFLQSLLASLGTFLSTGIIIYTNLQFVCGNHFSYYYFVVSCENDGTFTKAYRWILKFIDSFVEEPGLGETIRKIL